MYKNINKIMIYLMRTDIFTWNYWCWHWIYEHTKSIKINAIKEFTCKYYICLVTMDLLVNILMLIWEFIEK